MKIEIADRLVKLRKKFGYSQEELANKLGISRQAVSKWERAEASPDTDNLICLAKLYGVSLDELLIADIDLDNLAKEKIKDQDKITIDNQEVCTQDESGSSIVINNLSSHSKAKYKIRGFRFGVLNDLLEGTLFLVAAVTYLLLGSLADMWQNGWIVFLLPGIICSLIRAIDKRNARYFNISLVVTFIFFFVCMIYPGLDADLWHPMWIIFLVVPIYYSFISALHRSRVFGKPNKDEGC